MGPMEIGMVIVLVVTYAIGATVLASLYQKCGTNEALIISGYSEAVGPRVLVGGGSIVIPLLQTKELISLEVMPIELKGTTSYASNQGTLYDFDGVVEAAIGSNQDQILKAAQSFGSKDIRDIRSIIYDIVQDSIRKCIEQNNDASIAQTEKLASQISEYAKLELERYGVEIHGLRVREVRPVKRSLTKDASNTSSNLIPTSTSGNNSAAGLPNLTSQAEGKIVNGSIAIVSEPITTEKPGEVTYMIENSSQRIVLPAKHKIPGKPMEIGSPVIIQEVKENFALVELWSEVYLHYPSKVS